MPNNRVKTSKALQSKKGKAALSKLHPHSRRAKQLTRVGLRCDKLSHEKKERRKIENSKVNRLLWFSLSLDPDLSSISLPELHKLLELYLNRNTDQLESERSERRTGRPKSMIQERIELELERESEEYSTGFVLPDLTSPQNVFLLRQWAEVHSGDPSFMPRIRLIRIFRDTPDKIIEEQKGAADSITLVSSSADQDQSMNQPLETIDQTKSFSS
ncbi:hypothetical protein BY996DRAFT_6412878 [Phakopsora pachyrhizi]|uniref:Translation machinery-associated protein 16 n=1 Tax=Phakopsora pachyrhizi TaxID=170000 RepID=A0AAV0ATP6_PHAPC|nr:hypothetical protein BY996DRAFT_6412878 [Phakopsora pachyrhizi]CAH7672074.1 hypothetical protein PPACK8108_LOCUS6856 [Phakopsora pachyrhizi]